MGATPTLFIGMPSYQSTDAVAMRSSVEVIDDFLMSDRAPENSMGISDLDGFLTGIVIGPELIMPSEWLARVWGGESPRFKSLKEADRIISAIMAHYNEIARNFQMLPPSFSPIFFETEDGIVIASDWACGFHDAMMLRLSSWEPLLQDEEARDLLDPILVLAGLDSDTAGLVPEIESYKMKEAADDLADAVFGIHQFWIERSVRH